MARAGHTAILASGMLLAALFSAPLVNAQSQTQASCPSAAEAEQNRQVVLTFQEQFFNRHDLSAADRYVAESYVQHNPTVADGRRALVETFAKIFDKNPQAHSQIIRSAVDCDLVYVHLHSTANPADRGRAIVNIYRVNGGKITEHWDVIQAVPEQSTNINTMF